MEHTPRKQPKQARALRKREALVQSAFHEFSEKGYEATTAKRIAARARVATGTFYQNFDNKDHVLLELARRRFAELHERIRVPPPAFGVNQPVEPDVRETFREALVFLFDFKERDQGLHEVLEYRRRLDPALQEVIEAGEKVLMDRVRAYVARYVRDDVENMAYCLFAMAEGLVHRFVFGGEDEGRREDVIEQAVVLLAAHFEQRTKTN